MKNSERIIVALDCSEHDALRLAQNLQGQAAWLKVGMTLYYQAGPKIVAALKDLGYSVFVDLKLHDIPHQVGGAARAVADAGADMLTMHISGGKAMLEAARQAVEGCAVANGSRPVTLGITVLTSLDDEALHGIGVIRPAEEQVLLLAGLAREAGLSGIVCSPKEAHSLRSLWPNAVIVTPGVRPASSDAADQSRIATPAQAIANGADYLVIGRPITAAPDPAQAFAAIAAELE